jgi:Ion channel
MPIGRKPVARVALWLAVLLILLLVGAAGMYFIEGQGDKEKKAGDDLDEDGGKPPSGAGSSKSSNSSGTSAPAEDAHHQKWDFFSAFYFCVITLTTVGFGDLSPATHGGKAFVVVFSCVGLVVLAAFVATAGEAFFSGTATATEIKERRRRRLKLGASGGVRGHVREYEELGDSEESSGGELSVRATNTDNDGSSEDQDGIEGRHTAAAAASRTSMDAPRPEALTLEVAGARGSNRDHLGGWAACRCNARSLKRFSREIWNAHRIAVLSVAALWLSILFSATVFSWVEDWAFGDAVYFSFIAVSTIGYGDMFPRTAFGKAYCIVYVILGLSFYTYLISRGAKEFAARVDAELHEADPTGDHHHHHDDGHTPVSLITQSLVEYSQSDLLTLRHAIDHELDARSEANASSQSEGET